jgi:hypothetical protein
MPPGIVDTLGYPLDREQFQEGEPYQLFDNGGIYCYQGCGSAVFTPLEPVWQQLREMGIGLPVRDVVGTEQLGGGWLGRFVNGFIITDPDGADYVSCTYDGDVIATNLPLTDCYGFAAYVRSLD